ncbi:MAG: D-alanyl-D-alanine carboxypeptidase [Oscillospiraceae bacterium]|nr:D-alanyl-D-alanine carboxypeptidase [Oscillospiraceae bacterium]
MKRVAAAVFALWCLMGAAWAQAPDLSAESAVLMDAASGRVLYERSAHQPRDIASITKLMTALVAVERSDSLDEIVTIQPQWTGVEGSSLYLKPGEQVSLRTLLYGLLLQSGNDAAVAIAGYCAGDVESFVGWMNDRAAQLGMEQTHFSNPNGLSEQEHYSTAYDMALLAAACCDNPTVAEIAATRSITLEGRSLTNHNKLLWLYPGCTGLKTGYTQLAGRTLVSSAEKQGQTLVAVTLCDPDDWDDHAALFDFGFSTYPLKTLCSAGDTVAHLPVSGSLTAFVPVQAGETLTWPLAEGEQVETRLELPDSLEAPVVQGQSVGELCFYLEGELLGQVELLAAAPAGRDVIPPKASFWERILSGFSGYRG